MNIVGKLVAAVKKDEDEKRKASRYEARIVYLDELKEINEERNCFPSVDAIKDHLKRFDECEGIVLIRDSFMHEETEGFHFKLKYPRDDDDDDMKLALWSPLSAKEIATARVLKVKS